MAYTKTLWTDGVTDLSAANLNKIEQGVADAHSGLDTVNNNLMSKVSIDSFDNVTKTGITYIGTQLCYSIVYDVNFIAQYRFSYSKTSYEYRQKLNSTWSAWMRCPTFLTVLGSGSSRTASKMVESVPVNGRFYTEFWEPLSDGPIAVGDYYTLEITRGDASGDLKYARILLTGNSRLWVGHYENGVVAWTEK